MDSAIASRERTERQATLFSEAASWRSIGAGWKPLHGSFHESGFSIEWHDFTADDDLDWSPSFHANAVEICLNLDGHGLVEADGRRLELKPLTAGFYLQDGARLTAIRAGGERHRFVTVELSFDFLSRHIAPDEAGLHPCVECSLNGTSVAAVSEPIRLIGDLQRLADRLRRPRVPPAGRRLWYQAKAIEVASALLYESEGAKELLCQRCKRLNSERVQRVVAILKEHLAEAPNLEEIGRRVGCSPFYLSRLFSQEMGHPIFQHLRELRMDRAAQLLREGRLNVTQVAMEVGYSSPSHFSAAFHETFGCCPGLFPLKTLGHYEEAE